VYVPDTDVLGEVGEGWHVAMSTAGNERGLSLRSPGRFLAAANRLVRLWQRVGDPTDTATRDRVIDAWMGARAYQLYTFHALDTPVSGPGASANKVYWSELDVALHETALDLLGPQTKSESSWLDGYLFALAGPIYAGTNEIQRTVIAERVLGLPREVR
jgi:alkylation response protein AidB-like acyl-CoA dehydrogenase